MPQPAACVGVPRVAASVRVNLRNLLSDAGREILKCEVRQVWGRGIPLGSQTGESECKHLEEDQYKAFRITSPPCEPAIDLVQRNQVSRSGSRVCHRSGKNGKSLRISSSLG